MQKTGAPRINEKITVDIIELMTMLSLGKTTAANIGKEAGAVITVGRRKLYNVAKIKAYMNNKAEG